SIDVDIRIASGPSSGADSHQLTHDELFPVCSPRLLARGLRLRHPTDLRSQTLMTSIGFAQGWRQWFQAAKVKETPPVASLEFDSMRLALETAALGHGVALARTSYVDDLLRSGQLKRLFNVRLLATDNLYLT